MEYQLEQLESELSQNALHKIKQDEANAISGKSNQDYTDGPGDLATRFS
tara:strand:+ start:521 stop:667 length:147 start_codon:yes stop_codon:yes gene_type:complete